MSTGRWARHLPYKLFDLQVVKEPIELIRIDTGFEFQGVWFHGVAHLWFFLRGGEADPQSLVYHLLERALFLRHAAADLLRHVGLDGQGGAHKNIISGSCFDV
jgi:hypothetical protein